MTESGQMSQSDGARFVSTVFEKLYKDLKLYAIGQCRRSKRLKVADGEDIVMDVFLKMLEKPDFFKAKLKERGPGYLFEAIRNATADILRRKQRFDHLEKFLKERSTNIVDPYHQSTEERANELLELFKPYLDELDLDILGLYFAGYRLKDIGAKLGETTSNVYSRFNRIKKKLKGNLDNHPFED